MPLGLCEYIFSYRDTCDSTCGESSSYKEGVHAVSFKQRNYTNLLTVVTTGSTYDRVRFTPLQANQVFWIAVLPDLVS